MRRSRLARTIAIAVACVAISLPMTLCGAALAGPGNVLGTQTRLAAETFMNEAMYLRFSFGATDLAFAHANVSAINDLCAKMAAFLEVFQEYAAEEPAAAAILGQAQDLQTLMQQVAMMRQGELDGLEARNEAGGMLASAEPGTYLAAASPEAEDQLMDGLANFKKSF